MRRTVGLMLVGGLVAALGSTSAQAQAKPYIFFGGGANLPMGHFKDDGAKTGWMATGGIGANVGNKGLWIEGEGYFGKNTYDTPGDKVTIIGGIGALGYSFTPDKKASPYVSAGAGFLSGRFRSTSTPADNSNSTKFAYTGALGVLANLSSKVHFFLEGRFLATKDNKMIPILTGLSIDLGK